MLVGDIVCLDANGRPQFYDLLRSRSAVDLGIDDRKATAEKGVTVTVFVIRLRRIRAG